MHPHVSLILVAAVYLLPNFESSCQTHPRLEIRRNDGATLLDYFPQSSEGGTAMLHFSDELEGLTATVAGLFQIPQGNAGLNWDVTSMATGARGFFHVTEHPGLSIADFVSEDLEPDPPTPPIFSLEALLSPPLHLAPGLSYHLRFRVIDGATGLPVTADGAARIHLLTAGGLIPAGSYTIIPDTLPMSEGVVD